MSFKKTIKESWKDWKNIIRTLHEKDKRKKKEKTWNSLLWR
jgi:hypothetical protein